MLGDTLASVGVLVGGIIMFFTGWYLVDAILGAVIAGLLVWTAKSILSEAAHILLEGVPKGISISEVENALTAIQAIKNIHELHIWCICSNIYALSAHALINEQKVNQVEPVLDEVKDTLKTRFNITHSTIQFETSLCDSAESLCDIKH